MAKKAKTILVVSVSAAVLLAGAAAVGAVIKIYEKKYYSVN